MTFYLDIYLLFVPVRIGPKYFQIQGNWPEPLPEEVDPQNVELCIFPALGERMVIHFLLLCLFQICWTRESSVPNKKNIFYLTSKIMVYSKTFILLKIEMLKADVWN